MNTQHTHLPFQLLYKQFSGTCIVLGSGPSQANLPKNAPVFTITANYANNHIPNSLNYYQDKEYAHNDTVTRKYNKYRILSLYSTNGTKHNNALPGFEILKSLQNGVRYLHDASCPTMFSGVQACVAAHLMGFQTILAVGLDAKPDKEYLYSTPHPTKGSRNHKIEQHTGLLSYQYDTLVKFAPKYNIINCSYSDWAPQQDINQYIKTNNKDKVLKNIEYIYLQNACKRDKDVYLSKEIHP